MTKNTTQENQFKHIKKEEQEKGQHQEARTTAKGNQKENPQKDTKENHHSTDHRQKDTEKKLEQKVQKENHHKTDH